MFKTFWFFLSLAVVFQAVAATLPLPNLIPKLGSDGVLNGAYNAITSAIDKKKDLLLGESHHNTGRNQKGEGNLPHLLNGFVDQGNRLLDGVEELGNGGAKVFLEKTKTTKINVEDKRR